MIQANELRIGNKVKSPFVEGGISNVDGLLPDRGVLVIDGTMIAQNIEPVTLTTNVIKLLGFEDIGQDGRCFAKGIYQLQKADGGYDFIKFWMQIGVVIKRLAHLHDLQNLFFALTGTELTINLEKVKV